MNLLQVQTTLREEGCPEFLIQELGVFHEKNPNATVGQANRYLDTIVGRFGYVSYRDFLRSGFRPVVRDHAFGVV